MVWSHVKTAYPVLHKVMIHVFVLPQVRVASRGTIKSPRGFIARSATGLERATSSDKFELVLVSVCKEAATLMDENARIQAVINAISI